MAVKVLLKWRTHAVLPGMRAFLPALPRVGDLLSMNVHITTSNAEVNSGPGEDYKVTAVRFVATERGEPNDYSGTPPYGSVMFEDIEVWVDKAK